MIDELALAGKVPGEIAGDRRRYPHHLGIDERRGRNVVGDVGRKDPDAQCNEYKSQYNARGPGTDDCTDGRKHGHRGYQRLNVRLFVQCYADRLKQALGRWTNLAKIRTAH